MDKKEQKFAKNEHAVPLQHDIIREATASGYPRSHFYWYNSRAEAEEAAKCGKKHTNPVHHARPMQGPAHFHSVDADGRIIKDGKHYCYG